jgi:hypothetical protein
MAVKKIVVGGGGSTKKESKPTTSKKETKAPKAPATKKEAAPKSPKPKNEGVEVTTHNLPDVMPVTGEAAESIKADTKKANTRKPKAVVSEAEKHESVQRRKAESEAKKAAKVAEKEAAKAAKAAEIEAAKADPMYVINKRRSQAKFPFLAACVHCGSADVNANRSPYKSEVNGEPTVVREFHCHECHKYTKANATTGKAYPADATVKNLGYVVTRNNYHRPKGHTTHKAVELAGLGEAIKDAPGAEDFTGWLPAMLQHFPGLEAQLNHLGGLLSLAMTPDTEEGKKAANVLKDNLVLTF